MTFRFKSNALLNRTSLCASSNLQRYFTERPAIGGARARARDFQQFHDIRLISILFLPSCSLPSSLLLDAFYQRSIGKIMAFRRDAVKYRSRCTHAAFDFIFRWIRDDSVFQWLSTSFKRDNLKHPYVSLYTYKSLIENKVFSSRFKNFLNEEKF